MADNESTMKWKVDISELKSAMQDAKRSISLANAEFKTATAGLDKWGNSMTGVEAKLKQLNAVLPQQNTILQNLEKQYSIVAENMGENSSEAQRLKIQIENQKAAIAKTEASITQYGDKLDDMKTSSTSLTQTISDQESELSSLKTAYVDAVAQYGKNSKEAKTLANEITSLSGELAHNKSVQEEASKAADELDETIDDVGESAEETEEDVKDLSDGFTVMKGAMADLVAQGITAVINGFIEIGKAAVDMGKQAIMSYADYEQLVGGVETLFGSGGKSFREFVNSSGKTIEEATREYSNMQKAQETVLNNAAKAYKTAGMSQNEYMETVTSFSASLINSLGGDTLQAAKLADQAIVDMSDNANRMGSDMQSIQNAYQGFAKQNYTMLDNLNLGYAGTKEGMEKLLQDADNLSDSFNLQKDASGKLAYGYADIVEAIHIVQTEMGITGTTAKEAASTISGSLNMTKAAWSNLLTGMADDSANFDQLVSDLVESVLAVGNNILPRIQTVVTGMASMVTGLIQNLLPPILEQIPQMITELLPLLISASETVITALISALPSLLDAFNSLIPMIAESITKMLPLLLKTGIQVIISLINGISSAVPQLLKMLPTLISDMVSVISEMLPDLVSSGIGLITALVQGLIEAVPLLIEQIPVMIDQLMSAISEQLPVIIQAGVDLILSLITGLTEAIPLLVSYIPTIIQSVCDAILPQLPLIIDAGTQVIMALIDGLIQMLPQLIEYVPQIIDTVSQILLQNLPLILEAGVQILMAVINGLIKALPQLISYVPTLITSIVTVITKNLPKIIQSGVQILVKLISGLAQALPQLISYVPQIISTIVEVLIQNLPQILAAGIQIIGELISGIGSMLGSVGEAMAGIASAIISAVSQIPSKMLSIGSNIVSGIWSGISNGLGWIKGKISGWVGNVTSFIKNLFGIGSPSKVMRDQVGKWLPEGMAEGFEQDMPAALLTMKKSLNGALGDLKTDVALQTEGIFGNVQLNGSASGSGSRNQVINFNQYNNSPKALDRLSIYRETNSLLFSAKVRLGNV